MSLFTSQSTEKEEVEQDSLGGKKILSQDVYPAIIEMAYLRESLSSKSVALNVVFRTDAGDIIEKPYWFINKEGNNFTTKDGKQRDTFGMTQLKALSRVAIGGDIPDTTIEPKTIKKYDFDARKEVPTEVQMMMGLVKAPVQIAVTHLKRNKGVKQADGKYKDVGELIEENDIAKVFSTDGHTASEIMEGVEAEFITEWLDHNKGKVVDKFKPDLVKGSSGGSKQATNKTAPLFGA